MLSDVKVEQLKETAKNTRILIMRMLNKIGLGHIGGAMSIVEALTYLYFEKLRIDPGNPRDPDRDRFVLSKGHAGPALYAALALRGYFPVEECLTLNQSGTNLPSHCDMLKTIGVDMTAGSLGQGISAAVGMALAGKLDKKDYKVYCIVGDGESQEGQVWEAFMFAASRKLDNLVIFMDHNKMQIDGMIEEINALAPVVDKCSSFGLYTQRINGHDFNEIDAAIRNAENQSSPAMIILDTIKGKGAIFAENLVTSHNMPVSDENLEKAIAALNG